MVLFSEVVVLEVRIIYMNDDFRETRNSFASHFTSVVHFMHTSLVKFNFNDKIDKIFKE